MVKPIVIRVDPLKPEKNRLLRAAEAARKGMLVVYPTDTVYGLGTNPFDEKAVLRVYEAKKRPPTRPLPVLVSGPEAAENLVKVTEKARILMEEFWPGPLTIVLPAKPGVPRALHAGTGKIGVRMPNHRVALLLIELAGGALVGTSANLHRHEPPRTAEEALRQLNGAVDVVVDAGPAPGGIPSTVVELENGKVKLIREGPIKLRDIEARLI
ncbi:hypothetical protein PYJP_07520 [Pyrofollis japonicus]|uniref:L-threonylcarbamoyladenylate synthase n=1 Tax=Pyrofollis japonicus TaxID=3060460 RepID=UPI00295A5CB5|nr:L-threonylcarbamoyladenylate synthase [Pyrofollis japonicus]BEP17400.1 hypothetical protein PYJP_07520 [Pyrofollis japonicus]